MTTRPKVTEDILYTMGFDEIIITGGFFPQDVCEIRRTINGWIYTHYGANGMTSVFVPEKGGCGEE